jgi:hypothetical protein
VLKSVKYWGTPRNDGFVMMPNELETHTEGPKAYEFKGTNGFMLTFDMTSKAAPRRKALRWPTDKCFHLRPDASESF